MEATIHNSIIEYHCGRLQGITKKQALVIAESEGITYEEFRAQGGMEVYFPCLLSVASLCFICGGLIKDQTFDGVIARIGTFWEKEMLPLRNTDSVVLLVTHGGLISALRKYLMSRNYKVVPSINTSEVRNCSITEIVIGERGPGEFVRMGNWQHIIKEMELNTPCSPERLESSTG